ncbi:MAG: metallophosphoesterase family protein [Eubacterium sp.]|nr:metallophosphoesterase family protein [Eubacterium sp.]
MKNKSRKIGAIALVCTLACLSLQGERIVQGYGEVAIEKSYSPSGELITEEAYNSWSDQWQKSAYASVADVIMTPGDDPNDLNLCWYSQFAGSPAVAIGQKKDLSDASIFTGSSRAIDRSTGNVTYTASNQVCLEDRLSPSTTYYYRVTNDVKATEVVWSDTYKYQNQGTDSYTLLMVGDAQIGASGDVAQDTYGWNSNLKTALSVCPNPAFLVSLGDQINYKTDSGDDGLREREYSGFLYPSYLREIPVAAVIGNHDSMGYDYSYHFNNPNSSQNLGATEAGCDYYFARGDALFLVLNSNNHNQEEHRQLIKKALAAYPDAKWRIALFHHDIYGSGYLHSNRSAANMRILFAPLMDEFKIDLAFSGHDHSYVRSYPIFDGTALKSSTSSYENPQGTIYLSLGSSSGSKMYGLADPMQYYVAERSNHTIPTFSTLEVTADSLTLKTYDRQGKAYADDLVVKKTESKINPAKKLAKCKAVKKTTYTIASYQKFQTAITAFEKILAATAADPAIAKIQNNYGKTNDPLTYYGYATGTSSACKQGFSTLLDKTLYANTTATSMKKYLKKYKAMITAKNNLKKSKLVVRARGKKITRGDTLKLAKGKILKLKVTKNPKKKKLTFSSNMSHVKINAKGRIRVVGSKKKKATITVAFQNRKFKFYIKPR